MLQALTLLPKSPFLQVSSPSSKSLNRPAPLRHKADTFHASSTQRTGSLAMHPNQELLLNDYYYNRLAPLKTESLERVVKRTLPALIKSGYEALIIAYPGGAKALKTPDYSQLLLHLGSLKTATDMLFSDNQTRPLKDYQTHLAKVVKLLEQFSDYEKAHQDLRAEIQAKIPAIKEQQAEGGKPLVLIQAESLFLNSPKELSLAYILDLLTLDSGTFSKRMEEQFARLDVEEEKRITNTSFIQRLKAWKAKKPEGLTWEDNPYETYIPLAENSPTKTRLLDPHTQALLDILEEHQIPYAFVPTELRYRLKEVWTDSDIIGSNFTIVPPANYKGPDKAEIPMVHSKHPSQIGLKLLENGMTGWKGGTHSMYKGVLYMPELVPHQGVIARRAVQMSDLVYQLRQQGQDVPLVIGSPGFSAGVAMVKSISPPIKTW